MSELKKEYLDVTGVDYLVKKLDARENTKDAKILEEAKTYADGLSTNYDVAGTAQTKVDELADGQVKTNKEAIEKLNGDESIEGSVKKSVKTAKDAIEAKIGKVTDGKTVVEMIEDAKKVSTYDDTQIKADIAKNKSDIASVVADYLKATDKSELVEAINTAKTETISAIMGEAGIDEKYDTLKEIADWILADTTNSASLVAKVDGIYNDYLKGVDKSELEGKINEVKTLLGEIPEDATSTTVIEYVKEVVDALKIGDYAKASDLTTLAGRVTALEGLVTSEKVAKWDVAETNAKTYADELNSSMDAKVAGVDTRVTELESKVAEGFTVITTEQIDEMFN